MVRVWCWLAVAAMLVPSHAAAQARTKFLAARVGANLVGNTYRFREERPTMGAGLSGGIFLSSNWVTELEAWFRPSSPVCCTGSEQLVSLNAMRLYAESGIAPYLAGGVALLHTQGAQDGVKNKLRLQVQVTAGVRLPISRRLALDLDLRGNGGGSTMIVRSAVGAVYFF